MEDPIQNDILSLNKHLSIVKFQRAPHNLTNPVSSFTSDFWLFISLHLIQSAIVRIQTLLLLFNSALLVLLVLLVILHSLTRMFVRCRISPNTYSLLVIAAAISQFYGLQSTASSSSSFVLFCCIFLFIIDIRALIFVVFHLFKEIFIYILFDLT